MPVPISGAGAGPYTTGTNQTYAAQGANTAGTEGITSGTNPFTGFSARYNPANLDATIWDNPWMVLPDVFNGIKSTGVGYQSLRNLAADPLTLYNIMNGATAAGGSNSGDFANWLNNLYSSLGSVGGRGFSAKELLGNIFNAKGGTGEDASSLGNILLAGDASTQLRTLFNMLREATNVSMNPLAARGYQAATQRAGDRALNIASKQDANQGASNMPIYQILRSIAPGLVPG